MLSRYVLAPRIGPQIQIKISQYYLSLAKDGRLRQTVRIVYFGTDAVSGSNEITPVTDCATISDKTSSVLFDNVASFGETPLLGSSRLIRNLKTARSQARLFRAIIQKLA